MLNHGEGYFLSTLQFIPRRRTLQGRNQRNETRLRRRTVEGDSQVAQTRAPVEGGCSACACERKEDLVDASQPCCTQCGSRVVSQLKAKKSYTDLRQKCPELHGRKKTAEMGKRRRARLGESLERQKGQEVKATGIYKFTNEDLYSRKSQSICGNAVAPSPKPHTKVKSKLQLNTYFILQCFLELDSWFFCV